MEFDIPTHYMSLKHDYRILPFEPVFFEGFSSTFPIDKKSVRLLVSLDRVSQEQQASLPRQVLDPTPALGICGTALSSCSYQFDVQFR